MNNNYGNKAFPGNPIYNGNIPLPNQTLAPNYNNNEQNFEQSYIENILRLNKGKKVTIYMTFPDSKDYRDLAFKGVIEQSGRDHIIISEPATGKWQLLLMIYVDYMTFDEQINYSQQFIPNN
ncbi:MAG: spore coat protein GerQ [Bacilli bacterium]